MNLTSKTRALAYLAAVFLVGLITGWVLGYAGARHTRFAPPPPGDLAEHVLDRFQRDLDLTPDQVRQIRPLVGSTSSNLSQLQVGAMTQGEQLVRTCDQQIRQLLNPEQRARFDQLMAERDRHRQRGHRPKSEDAPCPEPGAKPSDRH